jgi:prepilin-type N-terminal cleavage/methylation domain-containing protein
VNQNRNNITRRLQVHAAKEERQKVSMKNRTSRKSGFTLVEIMIVVAIIGLLAAIAIPNFVRARTQSQKNACINNLRQIDSAVQTWALENKQAANASVGFSDIVGYLKNEVKCPAGGTAFSDSYTLNGVTNKPVCQKVSSTHLLPPDTTQ